MTRLTGTTLSRRLAGLIFMAGILMPVASAEDHWRIADPENILSVETDLGRFFIELAPAFAPRHTGHMQEMTRQGFFDNRDFYRVIENFVAQTGSGDDMLAEGNKQVDKFVKAELVAPDGASLSFTPTGNGDAFAPETGFVNGFPAARDPATGEVWMPHCPGTVGMARNDDPDSGGTDWYIVIGQSPRHLDRNISMFGRIIYGMDVVHSLPRGSLAKGGMIQEGEPRGHIRNIQVLADMDENTRPTIEVMHTDTDNFRQRLESYKKRTHPWFVNTPSEVLDVCTIRVHTRISWP